MQQKKKQKKKHAVVYLFYKHLWCHATMGLVWYSVEG